MSESWTTLKVLEWTTGRFARGGLDSPRLDAQVLLAHALSCSRVQLYTRFDQPLAEEELAAYRAMIKRRLSGVPVAYLVGEQEFWSLSFRVDESVLIPRRDTETIIEVILDEIDATSPIAGEEPEPDPEPEPESEPESDPESDLDPELDPESESDPESEPEPESPPPRPPRIPRSERGARKHAWRIADIATGSGAIAITLASELSAATVVATELSPQAASVARDNTLRHALADRVEIRVGSLCDPIANDAPFDIIVANPPYIPTAELSRVSADVRSEPALALDGGADGLDILRPLIHQAARQLVPGGLLVLEHGYDQAEAVAALINATHAYEAPQMRRDLGKRPRVTHARRKIR